MGRTLLYGLLLVAATFGVYARAGGFDFIELDDRGYVLGNYVVRQGLTREGFAWAFTTGTEANWHPLTWLSHMLDVELFGVDAGAHHLVNAGLHALATLLLFMALVELGGQRNPSAFVAALFGLHPLHVESVAWISERKDVLSGVFWMLTMLCYARYARRGGVGAYLLVVVSMALGLMAKPMLVTLPFVLLVLDYWPLGRWAGASSATTAVVPAERRRSFAALCAEKLPLMGLAAASCVATVVAQGNAGAINATEQLDLGVRASNALVAYVRYLGKTFWPADLAIFYPHPAVLGRPWGAAAVCGAAALLIVLTAVFFLARRRLPFVLAGWLWFLGTMVPVIGIVQVGLAAMADRYTYIPLIGVFVALAWSARAAARRLALPAGVLAAGAQPLLIACVLATWSQLATWRDSATLARHALDATEDNWIAHNILGTTLLDEGRTAQAREQFAAVLAIYPGAAVAHNNLGKILGDEGRVEEAIQHFREAIHISPTLAESHNNLAVLLGQVGRVDESLRSFAEAVRLDPNYAEAHNNAAAVLGNAGRIDQAIVHLNEVLRIQPDHAGAHLNLGVAYAYQERAADAARHLRTAIELDPGGEWGQAARGLLGELPAAAR